MLTADHTLILSRSMMCACGSEGMLLELLRAGYVQLNAHYKHCNKINVFPIPDGDTGTNMVISLRSSVNGITDTPPASLADAADLIAGHVILEAQGNSGQ